MGCIIKLTQISEFLSLHNLFNNPLHIDASTHEFEDKEDIAISTPISSSNLDLNTIVAALMENNQKLLEASRANYQRLEESSGSNSENILTEDRQEFQEASRINCERLEEKFKEASRANCET